MRITTLLFAVLLIIASSCKKKNKDVVGDNDLTSNINCGMLSIENYPSNPEHAFNFESANISWDLLNMRVSYSGGCADHCFKLVWSGTVPVDYPADVWLLMTHNNNGDNCESFITDDLSFDLTQMKNTILNQNPNLQEVTIFIQDYYPSQSLIYRF